MKKVISILLVLTFVLLLCGCNGKTTNETTDTSEDYFDFEYLVSAGRIAEADFALGTAPDEIISGFKEKGLTQSEEGYDENSFTVIEGNISYRITNGATVYYYNKGKEDLGVSVIVSFDTAYGFIAGVTTFSEIKQTVNIKDSKTTTADDKDLFFIEISMGEVKVLSYTSGNNVLKFYFTDDILFATTIENGNWKL